MLASDVDVIRIDVWTTLTPAANYTPPMVWSYVEAPNPRMWDITGRLNHPMNITFLNATQYKVSALGFRAL